MLHPRNNIILREPHAKALHYNKESPISSPALTRRLHQQAHKLCVLSSQTYYSTDSTTTPVYSHSHTVTTHSRTGYSPLHVAAVTYPVARIGTARPLFIRAIFTYILQGLHNPTIIRVHIEQLDIVPNTYWLFYINAGPSIWSGAYPESEAQIIRS
jgi:hypothetical protein